jgi:tetratricopeptide (TPR) repeat protein
LVVEWHAARRPGDATAFTRLSLLDQAAAVLSDPLKRREYDTQKTGLDAERKSPPQDKEAIVDLRLHSKPRGRRPILATVLVALSAIVVVLFLIVHKDESKPPLSQDEPGALPSNSAGDPSPRAPLSADALFARVSPSVVQVVIFNQHGRMVSSGSGFVLSKEGLIATNFHVVEKAHSAQIILADGSKVLVQGVAALDIESDLAIIKVRGPLMVNTLLIESTDPARDLDAWLKPQKSELQPLINTARELPIGAKVYAIGNPLGLANTLSEGLVSGYRDFDKTRVIQTTAPISPGSSGGPLLSTDGRVVGVTTFHFKGGQNLNFAVPAIHVERLLLKCESEGKLTPFPIGVNREASDHIKRGIAFQMQENHDKAIISFSEAIRIDPSNKLTYRARGLSWFAKNEVERAIKDYDEAIRIDSEYSEAFIDRGMAWEKRRDFKKAIVDYSEAILLDPNNAFAVYCRGEVWRKKKEMEKAIEDYNEAINLEPTNAHYYWARGFALELQKNYDRAIADYSKVIQLDPAKAVAFLYRGRSWLAKENYDKAIEDLNEAIRLDPKDALAYHCRGFAWNGKKQYDKARRDFDEAAMLDPEINK